MPVRKSTATRIREKKVRETGFIEKTDLKESLMGQAPLRLSRIGRTENPPLEGTIKSSTESGMADNPKGSCPAKASSKALTPILTQNK